MNKEHEQIGKLIEAYAEQMDSEEVFSFKAIDKPIEAKVTFGDDGLIETVQTWNGQSQKFAMSGFKNFTPEYAALRLIQMTIYEEEHPKWKPYIDAYESFIDTEEGMKIIEPYLKGLKGVKKDE